MSTPDRRGVLDRADRALSIRRQCVLLGIAPSGVYRPPRPACPDAADRRDGPAPRVHFRTTGVVLSAKNVGPPWRKNTMTTISTKLDEGALVITSNDGHLDSAC